MSSEIATAIRMVSADEMAARISELGALLQACVHAGASINFVLPFDTADAEAFWREIVVPAVAAGGRIVLVAERDGHIVGSVQLGIDTPPNQPHRAEVAKLMVHPDMRRRGIARSLMAAIEQEARRCGRSLLTLDTRTGDSAGPLYAALGYQTVGVIPGYCRDPFVDRLDSTTIMFKPL